LVELSWFFCYLFDTSDVFPGWRVGPPFLPNRFASLLSLRSLLFFHIARFSYLSRLAQPPPPFHSLFSFRFFSTGLHLVFFRRFRFYLVKTLFLPLHAFSFSFPFFLYPPPHFFQARRDPFLSVTLRATNTRSLLSFCVLARAFRTGLHFTPLDVDAPLVALYPSLLRFRLRFFYSALSRWCFETANGFLVRPPLSPLLGPFHKPGGSRVRGVPFPPSTVAKSLVESSQLFYLVRMGSHHIVFGSNFFPSPFGFFFFWIDGGSVVPSCETPVAGGLSLPGLFSPPNPPSFSPLVGDILA